MHTLLGTMWIPSGEQLRLVAPELALAATIVAVVIAPLIYRKSSIATSLIALVGACLTMFLAAGQAATVSGGGLAGLAPEGAAPMIVVDNLSVFFKLFLMLFLIAVNVLWVLGSAQRERHAPEFFVLLLSSALGMALMVSTLNLLMIVIAIELASLPSYAIAGFNKRSRFGAEASLKYVIFGSVCAGAMLYGASLLYGYYGSFDLGVIFHRVVSGLADPAGGGAMLVHPGGNLILTLGLLGLLVGVGFKISAVPFHFWCPDVFEGAQIEVTTWLSVVSKAAGLGLALRIVSTFSAVAHGALDAAAAITLLSPFAWTLGILGAITCTYGNLAAYRQTNVKRLLAWSSIAHAGYMLMMGAVLTAPGTPANTALTALLAYVVIYFFMNLGAFGVTAVVGWKTGSEDLGAFSGLGRRAPLLALPMAVCLFSLIGMPPLGGFIAKLWLLFALGDAAAPQPWLWGLIVVICLNTLLSLFYYVRIIREMYLCDDGKPAFASPLAGLALVNACAVALLLLGTLVINPLRHRAGHYAANLFTPAAPAAKVTAPKPDLASARVAAHGEPSP